MGHDGTTAYERCKGKRAKALGIEFGEGVHWRMKQAGVALGKLDSWWTWSASRGQGKDGGEIIIGDAQGVWRTSTIRRKPDADGDTHTLPWFDLEPDGEALPAVKSEYREIEDVKVQDNECRHRGIRTLKLEKNGG